MWFNPNTTILFQTTVVEIGEQENNLIKLKLSPELAILKDQVTKKKIFGIPISFSDKVINTVIWGSAEQVNDDYRVDVSPKFN